MFKRLASLIVFVAIAGAPGQACAQEAWSVGDYTAWTAVNMARLNEQVDDTVQGRALPETPDAQPTKAWTFAASAARTKANLAQFVAKSRQQNPAAAADLQRTFAAMDIVGEAGKGMRALGLDPHNVADAYALWWILAWSAANQVESPSDAPTYEAVQAQARAAFTATPGLAGRSDADKQQFAEAMIVQAMILDSANDEVRGDPAQMRTLADHAKHGAKEMGLDLATMVLTSDGFRPREGAALDSSDTDPRLAAADPGAAGTTSLTTYAAIAAAGGAGIAAVFLAGRALGRRG